MASFGLEAPGEPLKRVGLGLGFRVYGLGFKAVTDSCCKKNIFYNHVGYDGSDCSCNADDWSFWYPLGAPPPRHGGIIRIHEDLNVITIFLYSHDYWVGGVLPKLYTPSTCRNPAKVSVLLWNSQPET